MKALLNYRNAAIAFVSFLTLATTSVNATDDRNVNNVELKFIGNYKNKPVFELNFNQSGTEAEYVVNIRDEYGNSLYRETISTTTSKKFLLNTDEIGDDTLRFEITGKKNNKTVVYTVNQNSRFVEEMLVTKLN